MNTSPVITRGLNRSGEVRPEKIARHRSNSDIPLEIVKKIGIVTENNITSLNQNKTKAIRKVTKTMPSTPPPSPSSALSLNLSDETKISESRRTKSKGKYKIRSNPNSASRKSEGSEIKHLHFEPSDETQIELSATGHILLPSQKSSIGIQHAENSIDHDKEKIFKQPDLVVPHKYFQESFSRTTENRNQNIKNFQDSCKYLVPIFNKCLTNKELPIRDIKAAHQFTTELLIYAKKINSYFESLLSDSQQIKYDPSKITQAFFEDINIPVKNKENVRKYFLEKILLSLNDPLTKPSNSHVLSKLVRKGKDILHSLSNCKNPETYAKKFSKHNMN